MRRVYDNGVLIGEFDDISQAGITTTSNSLTLRSAGGTEILRIGVMPFGDRGLRVTRETGTVALEMRKVFSNSAQQTLGLFGSDGYSLIEEEPLGSGLSKPYLPIPLLPVTTTPTPLNTGPWGPEVSVTSDTFVTTHQAWWARANYYALFRMRIAASDTSTAGEVQVINVANGIPLNEFFEPGWLGVRPAGSTGYTEVVTSGDDGMGLPGLPHAEISVAVQVRRTAGAGTLRVAVPTAHGWSA